MASLLLLVSILTICRSRRDDYSEAALGDAITSLPGIDTATFEKYTMFSGYIDVYPAHNRSIFYWFVESLNEPTSDPVAVWTNGGWYALCDKILSALQIDIYIVFRSWIFRIIRNVY